MTGRTHPPDCRHCAAVRRPHPADCRHCAAVRRPHVMTCGHCHRVRALARDFAAWRHAAELEREAVCAGYRAEQVAYGRPMPTFRAYLEQLARPAGLELEAAA